MKTNHHLSPLALALAALAAILSPAQPAQAVGWTNPGSLSTARYGHTATLLPNGKVLVAAGRCSGYNTNSAELYDPATGIWTATGSLNTARCQHTATLLPNGKVLVAGGLGYLASAELYDPVRGIWTTTGSLNTGRQQHTATLLPNGKVLVAGGNSSGKSAELYDPASGTWTTTGSLNTGRFQHTATLLPNGKVLVAGGEGSGTTWLASAELYDPSGGSWTATGSLNTGRYQHTATLLANGTVLVAGGMGQLSGSIEAPLASAEVYNPTFGTWTKNGIGALNKARSWHTATLLPNGKVLVAGGNGSSGVSATAELYDPTSWAWTTTSSLNTARKEHTATLLPNGQVLVAGGIDASNNPLASAELYDWAAGSWTATGSIAHRLAAHTATLLPSGNVLVAGGVVSESGTTTNGAALYNPADGTWTLTGSLNTVRYWHTATLLANGKVLVAGGYDGTNALASAELFDPPSMTWTTTGSLNTARVVHRATLLPNGKVLVAGGAEALDGSMLASAELYDVGLGFSASWQPQIATAASLQTSGACLQLTGSQFRGVSEGSGGNGSQDSPADYPVVQLRRLDNEQIFFLPSTNWSATAFASAPVSGLPAGYALATVFVNAIPSTSSLVLVNPAALFRLTIPAKPSGGLCQVWFANTSGLTFTVLGSTNAALPLSSWTVLGTAAEILPGQYQFTDNQAGSNRRRFYCVRSP